MIRPVPHVAAITAYALAQLQAPEGKRLVSLSQNESLRPPSPAAIRAAAGALEAGHLYPDPDWSDLRAALAPVHGIAAGDILCGSGSMELIACLARAYADPENAVLAPAHAYPFFRTAALLARARYDTAPEVNRQVSVDALLAAVRPDTRLVFVANPGNPTGTRIARADLLRLRNGLPGDVLLVIDEAYGEFADGLDEPMFDLVARGDTVVLRTLSKAYGLAGARVGWGLFPPAVAREIRKVMSPNNIPAASQAAVAAAVADQAYMRETCALTAEMRDSFAGRLRQSGFDVPESHTNFVLIRLGDPDRAQGAEAALRAEGIILRPQGGVGLGDCLRATVGQAGAMDATAEILEHWARKETT